MALLQLQGAQADDDESARCTSAQPPLPPRPPPSPPLTRPPSPVQLRTATGVVIQPTPKLKAVNGSRYNGSLSSDPQRRSLVQGLYEVLAQESNVVAVHIAHVPRTDTYLYMERPSVKRTNAIYGFQIAGTFDLVTRNWTRVNSVDGLFCCGHTIDSEGRVVVTGGHKQSTSWPDGMRSVRIFDITTSATTLVNETWMSWKRWYPTPTLLPDGQIMIMGGRPAVGGSGPGVQEYEVYNPLTGARQYPLPCRMVEDSFYNHMKKMYYPFNFVLPTGDVMVFGERQVRIMVAQTGVFRTNGSGVANFFPRMPGTLSQFPYTATGVYGPLTFANNYSSVDLMVFGGAVQSAVDDQSTIAGRTVRRLKVSWKRLADGRYDYSSGDWTEEDLGIPRVMGDGTLLPNGDVLLLNGAQVGVAGDSGTSGGSGGRANYPNFWAQLYQPDKPLDKRVSTLAGSSIARMYHGVAALTSNGTILVSGCDRCYRLSSDVPSYVSPSGREEYRNEIFYPPYWFDTANKPRILTVNGKAPGNNGTTLRTSTTLGYAQTFNLTWGNATGGTRSVPPVTQLSLVAPSSTTHSFNANQRVVFLEILAIDYTKRQLTARTPPHPYIAPPQWYMVFALNGKTYSQAAWVRLVDQTGAGKVIPADYSNDRRKM